MTEQNEKKVKTLYEQFESFSDEYKLGHPLVFNYVERVNTEMVLWYQPKEVLNPETIASVDSEGRWMNVNEKAGLGEGKKLVCLTTGWTKTGKKILIDRYGTAATLDMFVRKGKTQE